MTKPHCPTYAPTSKSQSKRVDWQLAQWRKATGKMTPTTVIGPLIPDHEADQVMTALGRKTLPSATSYGQ